MVFTPFINIFAKVCSTPQATYIIFHDNKYNQAYDKKTLFYPCIDVNNAYYVGQQY